VVHPPAEVRGELAEYPRQEFEIDLAAQRLFGSVEEDRRPAVHRRIDVAEVPLIGRDLPGRMQEKSHQKEVELLLGEVGVDGGERNRVKRQVPGGEPRIFPFVRHRDDVAADQMEPFVIPDPPAWSQRIDTVFLQPLVHIVKEKLLAPQHPGQRLPHHIGGVFADAGRRYRPIEVVGLMPARLEDLREPRAERCLDAGRHIAQPQPDNRGRPGTDPQPIVSLLRRR
jgi:hypothetical protein